jgi:hypothetical protein
MNEFQDRSYAKIYFAVAFPLEMYVTCTHSVDGLVNRNIEKPRGLSGGNKFTRGSARDTEHRDGRRPPADQLNTFQLDDDLSARLGNHLPPPAAARISISKCESRSRVRRFSKQANNESRQIMSTPIRFENG